MLCGSRWEREGEMGQRWYKWGRDITRGSEPLKGTGCQRAVDQGADRRGPELGLGWVVRKMWGRYKDWGE